MQDSAMEFSARGDELFARFATAFGAAKRSRLLVEQPLADARFERIRGAATSYIAACLGDRARATDERTLLASLGAARETLPNLSADGLLLPKREQTLEYNALLKSVAAAFAEFDLHGRVDTVDPMVCVRVVHGTIDPARAALPHASSKLHSDIWAGIPLDAVVAVLPLFGDIENVTIAFGEMDRALEREWMRPLPSYDAGRDVPIAVPYRATNLRHGTFYFADGRLLHRTVRKNPDSLRVSLDFRFRLRGAEAYRALAHEDMRGKNSTTNPGFTYQRWLGIGDETLLAFDETTAAARTKGAGATPPGYALGFRTVRVFDRRDEDATNRALSEAGSF